MSERHAYFFKGAGYVRYNIDTDFVDVGPAPIAQFWTHLPKEFQSNLDAVVNWGDGHAYFFKGAGYVRYNIDTDFVDVGPAPIAQFWTHLPKEFQSNLDAVVNWGDGHAYFFKGAGYVRYNIDTDFVDVGPAPIAQFWTHLPKEFQSNLDAVVNWGDGHAYFFKGAGYVRYNIDTDFVDVGPAPIAQFWTHLPKEFQSDLDAVVNWSPVPRHLPKAIPGVTCFTRTPTDGDTLMVNGFEYTKPVNAFLNWKDRKKTFHGAKPPTAGQPQCRSLKQVNAIVLHETVGWSDNSATDRWGSDFATQFYVQTDASIAQHYDVAQLVQHDGNRNRHSVGVEFVNQVWAKKSEVTGGVFRPPAGPRNRSPRTVLPAHPPLKNEEAIWGEQTFYVVPPADQLEALWQLVRLLLDTVPTIPRVWLSLEHSEANNLFLMSKWPNLYDCIQPACMRGGIYSHYNIGDHGHTDGSFLTLYTWLRQQGLGSGSASGSALATAKDLVRNHLIAVGARRFVDVAPFLP